MLGIWETGTSPVRMRLHTAFAVELEKVLEAPGLLRSAGIAPFGFHAEPVDEPVVLAWMPAAAVYFHDPDGHLLEYITMLHDPPDAEAGVMPWSQWRKRQTRG